MVREGVCRKERRKWVNFSDGRGSWRGEEEKRRRCGEKRHTWKYYDFHLCKRFVMEEKLRFVIRPSRGPLHTRLKPLFVSLLVGLRFRRQYDEKEDECGNKKMSRAREEEKSTSAKWGVCGRGLNDRNSARGQFLRRYTIFVIKLLFFFFSSFPLFLRLSFFFF